MFFDGSLMKTGAGAGLLFISPLGKHLRYVLRLHFPASKNVAEYEALVNGLRIAIKLGVQRLDARGNSHLVINQVMKNSHCRDPKMEAYCDEVRCLEDKFYELELNHVAQQYNETADELAFERRSPPRPTPGLGFHLDSGRRSPPRSTPGLGLSLDLGGVTTSLVPTTPQGEAIITLPLASPGYGEQDRRPIWLAPIKQVMMAPRVLHDNGGSQPPTEARIRQQGSDSPDSCASTGLKCSSDGHDAT
jgi:ribonuclease HI